MTAKPTVQITLSHFTKIMKRVEKTAACWHWRGQTSRSRAGTYGVLLVGKKLYRAHRIMYETLRGPIPKGLTIDHKCETKLCVNPDHLEPVTSKENSWRHYRLHDRPAGFCGFGHDLRLVGVYRYPRSSRNFGNPPACCRCRREARLKYRPLTPIHRPMLE